MNTYRIGDAIANLALYLTVLGYFSVEAIRGNSLSFGVTAGALFVILLGCSYLNKRTRDVDEVRRIREERQLALGVPPDEVI